MTFRQYIRSVAGAVVAAVGVIAIGSPHVGAIDSREKMRQEAAAQSAKAAKAFDAIMQVPDKAIPRDLLAKARAIAVFPQVLKVAFAVGGEAGRGVVSKRIGDHWGHPVFLRAGGGSFGPQIGVSSTDLFVLPVYNKTAEDLLKESADTDATSDLEAFPRALTRYTGQS